MSALNGDPEAVVYNGMTLRDYFAAKAMAGIMSSMTEEENDRAMAHGYPKACEIIARDAYRFADAMIAERKK